MLTQFLFRLKMSRTLPPAEPFVFLSNLCRQESILQYGTCTGKRKYNPIYRYTVQVPYSIWSLNICMGLYFLFPVRDASSQVDSTHNVVFIVERIYRKWSLYKNPTYWIFFIPHAIPLGITATGFFAHGRLGFSLHGRFYFPNFYYPSIL